MNKTPLGIIIVGGLGNQLFMLFAGISKAIDENRDFLIYTPINNGNRKFYFDNIFGAIKNKNIILDNIYISNLPFKVFNDNNNTEFIPDNYEFIHGYFQNFKFSYHNKDKIIKLLELDNYINKYKFSFKVIGIHFRFDDALRPNALSLVAKPSYFIKAIEKLQEELKKRNNYNYYRYVIFSTQADDNYVNEYIKEINNNLKTPIDFIKSYDYFNNNIYDIITTEKIGEHTKMTKSDLLNLKTINENMYKKISNMNKYTQDDIINYIKKTYGNNGKIIFLISWILGGGNLDKKTLSKIEMIGELFGLIYKICMDFDNIINDINNIDFKDNPEKTSKNIIINIGIQESFALFMETKSKFYEDSFKLEIYTHTMKEVIDELETKLDKCLDNCKIDMKSIYSSFTK